VGRPRPLPVVVLSALVLALLITQIAFAGGSKKKRQGAGYIADLHYRGDGSPPFPGETNPDIRAYFWSWTEIVTRTKKGRLIDTISP
jgi:hypothetical protein